MENQLPSREAKKMRRYQGWLFIVSMLLMVWGCGKTNETDQTAAGPNDNQTQNAANRTAAKSVADIVKTDTPEATVQVFLEAVRTGNDQVAASMISTLARQRTAALNGSFTPPASDRAKFTIGKVEYVGEDGARVASVWTDVDENEQSRSDEYGWILRKEAEGWRVAGVAAFIFPGEEPLKLNFEDPDESKRVLQAFRERMESQEAGATENLQAEQKEKTDDSLRR
jgi:hypothetical protein